MLLAQLNLGRRPLLELWVSLISADSFIPLVLRQDVLRRNMVVQAIGLVASPARLTHSLLDVLLQLCLQVLQHLNLDDLSHSSLRAVIEHLHRPDVDQVEEVLQALVA